MRPTVHPESLLIRSSIRYRPMSLVQLLPRILLWAVLLTVFAAAFLAAIHVLFPLNPGGGCRTCFHYFPGPHVEL